MDVFHKQGLCLTLQLVNLDSDRRHILKATVVKDAENKASDGINLKCVGFFADPIESDSISNYPATLGALSEKLGSEKFEKELYDTIYDLIPENGISAKQPGEQRLFILVCIPRHRNGQLHRYDVIGYVLNVSLFEFAKDLGIIYCLDSKWYRALLIGGGAGDSSKSSWKAHSLLPVEVRNCLDSEFARNISGIEANTASFNGILAGVGALGGLLAVRRQLSWPVRVNYDGRLGFRILSGSSLF